MPVVALTKHQAAARAINYLWVLIGRNTGYKFALEAETE